MDKNAFFFFFLFVWKVSYIKKEELLIKNDNLYLVDFGWAKINDCWGCDIGLCNNEKPFLDKTIDKYKIFDILLEILNE